ncbi:GntR family transcriptional regulator [Streptomyces ardesiacus]|uniref:GntR family transcriptional regulator n=1 Tax=Streptomyces ardesiacus TaxID=285564 RepID=UPI00362C9F06
MPSRHHGIADDLRHQITAGCVKPGDRLPSEADLADRYGVSTVTLRRALALLQGEGLVEKIHGKGNFVRRPPRKVVYAGGWGILDPWTAAEAALRVTVHKATIEAFGQLTTLLQVPAGSPLDEYTCISHEGESPHGLAQIYIPRHVTPACLDDESPGREAVSRFAVLSRPPAALRETVCARPPTPEEASTLRTNTSAPVLAITRIVTDTTGRVVEAALLVFPGDRVDAIFTTHPVTEERQPQE